VAGFDFIFHVNEHSASRTGYVASVSSFNCQKCGTPNIDSGAAGYTAGCCHYPPEDDRVILLDFGATETAKGFYRGSFYRTESSYERRAAVHPVRWADIRVAPSEYLGAT
jgi:N-methylhydantoinase A/oxoprolinase/acetone carboxylase beta subunit